MDGHVFIGGGGQDYAEPQGLNLKYANRHGLIAGATGTGKTVTLQILAEGFSNAGVPVFLSDVKGDLSGLALPGSPDHKLHTPFTERAHLGHRGAHRVALFAEQIPKRHRARMIAEVGKADFFGPLGKRCM